jgi:peptidyl-prolyl cis-trans isomerase B (cyclophilin B)
VATGKRDDARRKLEAELAARQVRADSRRRTTTVAAVASAIVVIVVVIIIVAVASGGGSKKPAAGATTPTSTAAGTHVPGSCSFVAGGTASRKVSLPPSTAPTTGTVAVKVATNRGPMTFTLNRAAAPCTVASFVSLVQQKYFDDTSCHRLVTSGGLYVLQCGDPSASGSGGPGYSIPDEITGRETYTRGVLAMANNGSPNTGGSQFFIVYKDSQLPPQYTVFGTVTAGLDVVDAVAAKGDDGSSPAGGGKPKLPITLTKLTL